MSETVCRVLILHPDLGIGGAERLVVDAALALKTKNHNVSFLTNHHDPKHCFHETEDGTFKVTVVADWLPRQTFGYFYAFWAYLRIIFAALYFAFYLSYQVRFDAVICDQISVCIPILRLAANRPRIIFYCHFPDQLLSKPGNWLKRLYRLPLDFCEEFSMHFADRILVNSLFTLNVFRETFHTYRKAEIEVLYPTIDTVYFDRMAAKIAKAKQCNDYRLPVELPTNAIIVLDINRYERKKNHPLALYAFEAIKRKLEMENVELWQRLYLIIAGGYDLRVTENVQHYEELKSLANDLHIDDKVLFLKSPSDEEKFQLLDAARCLVYTPSNEHFGIVPLEAMYTSTPVVAVASGGPLESIAHDVTGFLCDSDYPDMVARSILKIVELDEMYQRFSINGINRVRKLFSFQPFAERLDQLVLGQC